MDIDSSNAAMEVVQALNISDDAAAELGGALRGDLGLVKDRTWGGDYFLVRWHNADEET